MNRARQTLFGVLTALAGLALLGTAPAAAQDTGSVIGTVLDRSNGQPVAGAQVSIVELELGTLTDQQGRFNLPQVQPGTYQIRVVHIGFRSSVQEDVVVEAGQTVRVDFDVQPSAIDLDEIVVTGTGVATQRKRLGQTINTVQSEALETAPIANVTDALQGRVPGLVANSLGETGSGSNIRLRGVVSLSQRNDPIIYIDGVRVDNSQQRMVGVVSTRLNDLNASDIERVEVIKGAAAATLYGTEASAGVIQIFTKRGQISDPIWSFQIDQQIMNTPLDRIPSNFSYSSAGGSVRTNDPAQDFIDTGHHQNYTLSVRGGSPGVQYFASGRWMEEDGTYPTNSVQNKSLKMALDFILTDRLSAKIDANVIRNELVVPFPSWGLMGEFVLADPWIADETRPYGELFYTIAGATAYSNEQEANTTTISGGLDYSWTDNLHSNLTIGYNEVDTRAVISIPVGAGLRDPTGRREISDRLKTSITVDFRNNLEQQLTERLSGQLVFGGQSFWEDLGNSTVGVRDFAAPSLNTLRGGSSVYTVDEFQEEVINAGVFAQGQIGLDDRLFLTAGYRLDGNSAFGDDFGFQGYPKAGLSWVVSDYDFWPFETWDQLRLRGAYGSSGLQPGAFDAQRTWQPVARVDNDVAVEPQNLGNANLKPERSTELEFAAEMGFLEGRVGAEFVYYDQNTKDALLAVPGTPSLGFLNTQLQNIGELSSKGFEAMLDVQLIDAGEWGLDLNTSFTTLDQEVVDMGGVAPFRVTGGRRFNRVQEGFAPGAVLAPVHDPSNPYSVSVPIDQLSSLGQITPNYLKAANGQDSLAYVGDALPTWTSSFGASIRMPGNLTLRGLISGEGGFIMSNETELIRAAIGLTERAARFQEMLDDPSTSAADRQMVADSWGNKHPSVISDWMEDGDYFRLAELALTWNVPEEISGRFGFGNTQITVGGRNLALFTDYSGIVDPGTTTSTELDLVQNIDYFGAPVPRRFTLSIRTTR